MAEFSPFTIDHSPNQTIILRPTTALDGRIFSIHHSQLPIHHSQLPIHNSITFFSWQLSRAASIMRMIPMPSSAVTGIGLLSVMALYTPS